MQEGEVVLLANQPAAAAAAVLPRGCSSCPGARIATVQQDVLRPSLLRAARHRTTADELAVGRAGGVRADGGAWQRPTNGVWQQAQPTIRTRRATVDINGSSTGTTTMAARASSSAQQLAVLGAGSVLGENVLGYDVEQVRLPYEDSILACACKAAYWSKPLLLLLQQGYRQHKAC
jgi:hypothetical protein